MSRVDRTKLPVPGPTAALRFPTHRARDARQRTATCAPSRITSVPVAAAVLLVPGGSSADATEQAGLASLTADLLDEGSRGHSALEISDRIARMGGDLDLEVSHDATVVSLATLDRFLDLGLALVHEICTAPEPGRARLPARPASSASSDCVSCAIIRPRSPIARLRSCSTSRIRTRSQATAPPRRWAT